jgi:hypothetical protein
MSQGPGQRGGEGSQLGDAALGLVQASADPGPKLGLDVRAGPGGPHGNQFGDLLQWQPEVLGGADERQPLDRVFAVEAVSGRGAVGW